MKYPNFWCKRFFLKDDVQPKKFLQDLGVLIVKIHLPIQVVKNTWLKICFAMHLCLRVVFLQKKVLFTRGVAQFGGDDKTRMCFYKRIKHATQSNLQKCITWPKKSRKGKQRWNKPCPNSKIFPRKLSNQILKSIYIYILLIFISKKILKFSKNFNNY
jgi:hypothetical protein